MHHDHHDHKVKNISIYLHATPQSQVNNLQISQKQKILLKNIKKMKTTFKTVNKNIRKIRIK